MTSLRIDRLGAQGDGVADTAGGPVYVPFALPGERVEARLENGKAALLSIEDPSPLRIAPACRHFTECGGCAIQHLEEASYRAWKRDKVVRDLAARGVSADVAALVPGHAGARRRAVFSARKTERGILFGYNRMSSNVIVDIVECPVVLPRIEAAIGMLRSLSSLVAHTRDAFHLTVTSTDSGLDVAVTGAGALPEAKRQTASTFALQHKLARLSVDGDTVLEPRKPHVAFGAALVVPPPGSFLQAVHAAEEAMAAMAITHLRKARKVADLFAGAGAFALRFAGRQEVHAVEADQAALAALDRGFRSTPGLKRLTTEKRDLFRRPLTTRELNAFDGVVFDPPRAGAEDQSRQLARSDVPLVVAVSCNATTLARDLRILLDGGYTLLTVTPVDQFLWSPHVEVVALLEKRRRRQ